MNTKTVDIAVLGECMAELTHAGANRWNMSFAGDVLNTAIYAARLGMRTSMITAVGDDALANDLKASWKREKIATPDVRTVRGGKTGLYIVTTDARGERSFTYYRSGSAASKTLKIFTTQQVIHAAMKAHVLYFTGVSLAVMGAHQRLLDALKKLDGATAIAFDPNYRAKLWSSVAAFRAAVASILPHVRILLLSADDAKALHPGLSPTRMLQRYARRGIACILKCGAEGAQYWDGHRVRRAKTRRVRVVDTTAAGDAFNAAVITGLLRGMPMRDSIARGNQLAGVVVHYPGAIVPPGTIIA